MINKNLLAYTSEPEVGLFAHSSFVQRGIFFKGSIRLIDYLRATLSQSVISFLIDIFDRFDLCYLACYLAFRRSSLLHTFVATSRKHVTRFVALVREAAQLKGASRLCRSRWWNLIVVSSVYLVTSQSNCPRAHLLVKFTNLLFSFAFHLLVYQERCRYSVGRTTFLKNHECVSQSL